VPTAPYTPTLATQLEPVWRHRPALLSFHFGLPPPAVIKRAQSLGICIGVTATRLEEARAIEDAGADMVIAQGIEAGGHRGCFDPQAADPGAHTEDLVRILARGCSLPVVAAGGIMHGSDIARMLSAGACAVQLGTAFLACEESGASPEHKRFVLQEHWREPVVTRSFSGRLARGLHNRFIARMDETAVLPFPWQNTLTSAMRQWAQERGDGEYQSLWAGSGYRNCRNEPVEALVNRLAREMQEANCRLR
jgi:nitronate monooxygenase